MSFSARFFTILLLLAGAAPAAALDFNLDKLLGTVSKLQGTTAEISESNELLIGEGIASNLLGAAPLVNDLRLQKYVNRIGRWVALQTERPDLPWRFGVLNSDDINAFAAPGGYVFITRGLLEQIHSEAELAGVLAHEISHVLMKHHLNAARKSARTGIAAELLGELLKDKAEPEVLNKAVSAGTELYARGLDKSDEFEADRMGLVIATRAGYDPYGLPAVLQTLHSLNPQNSALALMFKTHPSPDERLNLLEKLMGDNLDNFSTQPQIAERFSIMTSSKQVK